MRKNVLLIVGIVALVVGCLLMVTYLMDRLPDPHNTTADELAKFVHSERFADLEPDQRQLYIESLWSNMKTLDENQQKALGEVWQKHQPDITSPGAQAFGAAMLANIAAQYANLPPDQRAGFMQNSRIQIATEPVEIPANLPKSGPNAANAMMGMKELLNYTTPEQRSQICSFLIDMKKHGKEENGKDAMN